MIGLADPEDAKKTAKESAEEEPAPKRRARPTKPAKAAKAEKEAKPKAKKAETPALSEGHVHVYSLDGDAVKSVELPAVPP